MWTKDTIRVDESCIAPNAIAGMAERGYYHRCTSLSFLVTPFLFVLRLGVGLWLGSMSGTRGGMTGAENGGRAMVSVVHRMGNADGARVRVRCQGQGWVRVRVKVRDRVRDRVRGRTYFHKPTHSDTQRMSGL